MKYEPSASSGITFVGKVNSTLPFSTSQPQHRAELRAGSARGRTSPPLRPRHGRPLQPRASVSRRSSPVIPALRARDPSSGTAPLPAATTRSTCTAFCYLSVPTSCFSPRPLFEAFSPEAGLHRCTARGADRPRGTSWELARVRISACPHISCCVCSHSARAPGHDMQARGVQCHRTAILTENLVGWDSLKPFSRQRLVREVSSNLRNKDLDVILLVLWSHRWWGWKRSCEYWCTV